MSMTNTLAGLADRLGDLPRDLLWGLAALPPGLAWLAGAALGLAGALFAAHLATLAVVAARLWRASGARDCGPGPIGQPPVTLLRPVCGLDAQDEQTLASSFHQDYPDYRVIFCAPKADDPAVALLRRLIAAHPQVRAQILVQSPPGRVLRNPKLENLRKGWLAAQSDWICMADANLMLPRDYLARVTAAWGPATGLVSSPPLGADPRGLAAGLEAAFLNGNQARLQLAADSFGPGFAQGKTLFFSRPLLTRAGGLAALDDDLAEDAAATKLVRGLGLQVSMPRHPFAQPLGRRPLGAVLARQLRWSRLRRDAFPALFWAEPLNGALLPLGLAALGLMLALGAGPGLAAALAYGAAWYGAEIALVLALGWAPGWQMLWLAPLRDLAMPLLWLASLRRAPIAWRGTALAQPGDRRSAGVSGGLSGGLSAGVLMRPDTPGDAGANRALALAAPPPSLEPTASHQDTTPHHDKAYA